METQFEANADTKIGSDILLLVLCLHQDHKHGLYLKRCGVVGDISKRQSFSPTAKAL